MLYKFNIVLYSGGNTPSEAFSNLLHDIETTGLSLEDEVVFEEVEVPIPTEESLPS